MKQWSSYALTFPRVALACIVLGVCVFTKFIVPTLPDCECHINRRSDFFASEIITNMQSPSQRNHNSSRLNQDYHTTTTMDCFKSPKRLRGNKLIGDSVDVPIRRKSGSDFTNRTWSMASDATLSSRCITSGSSSARTLDDAYHHESIVVAKSVDEWRDSLDAVEREERALLHEAEDDFPESVPREPATPWMTVSERRDAFARTKHRHRDLLRSEPSRRQGQSSRQELPAVATNSKPKCPFCGLLECSTGCSTTSSKTSNTSLVEIPQDKTDHFFDRMETWQRPKFFKGKKRGPLPRPPSIHRRENHVRKVVQLSIPATKGEQVRVLQIEF